MKHLINWLIPVPVLLLAYLVWRDWQASRLTTSKLILYAAVLVGYVAFLALVELRYRRRLAQIRRQYQKGQTR